MSFELSVLFFNKKTSILSCTYEGIGIFVDDWKINLICLLGGHGNRKIVQYGLLGACQNSFLVFIGDSRFLSMLKTF